MGNAVDTAHGSADAVTDAAFATARNLTRTTTLATSLEVAASFWSKLMGLMGRRTLAAGAGVWLSGTNNIHMMFMRFPIDAVFLGKASADGSRRVVALRRSMRPWTGVVWFARGADGVIELPAGAIDASDTALGDLVRLDGVR
jgi:uncharacterized membrane protein (UPF0127 family)